MTPKTSVPLEQALSAINHLLDKHAKPGAWRGIRPLLTEIENALRSLNDIPHATDSDIPPKPRARKRRHKAGNPN